MVNNKIASLHFKLHPLTIAFGSINGKLTYHTLEVLTKNMHSSFQFHKQIAPAVTIEVVLLLRQSHYCLNYLAVNNRHIFNDQNSTTTIIRNNADNCSY